MVNRNRRGLLLAIAALAAPTRARAQAAQRIYRVAFWGVSAANRAAPVGWLEDGLTRRGFVADANTRYVYRFAPLDASPEVITSHARALVAARPDVMCAEWPFARALKKETAAVPILFMGEPDPVGAGLVDDLRRPGGNVTGLANHYLEAGPKRLELVRDLLPRATRVALLSDYRHMKSEVSGFPEQLREAAARLGLRIVEADVDVDRGGKLEATLAALARDPPDALMPFGVQRNAPDRFSKLLEFERSTRIPMIGDFPGFGVVAFGWDFADNRRRAIDMLVEILRGRPPAEIPVDQATRFQVTVNLKTAALIGLSIPPAVMVRADRVIR